MDFFQNKYLWYISILLIGAGNHQITIMSKKLMFTHSNANTV